MVRGEYFLCVAAPENGWRLLNAEFLRRQKFRFKRYIAPRPEWDHDHCSGCWAKFMDRAGPGIQLDGYAVTADGERREGYHWVCASCFEALKDQLDWSVVE